MVACVWHMRSYPISKLNLILAKRKQLKFATDALRYKKYANYEEGSVFEWDFLDWNVGCSSFGAVWVWDAFWGILNEIFEYLWNFFITLTQPYHEDFKGGP